MYTTTGLEAWYNEVYEYDYYENFSLTSGPPSGSGHFTQVVWKDTERLGCGTKGNYVVCRYAPPGNYRTSRTYEDYEANVGPLQ